MNKLITTPNITDPDGYYAQLLELHEGLDKETSDATNAKLILVLSNHIGNREILDQAIALVKEIRRTEIT